MHSNGENGVRQGRHGQTLHIRRRLSRVRMIQTHSPFTLSASSFACVVNLCRLLWIGRACSNRARWLCFFGIGPFARSEDAWHPRRAALLAARTAGLRVVVLIRQMMLRYGLWRLLLLLVRGLLCAAHAAGASLEEGKDRLDISSISVRDICAFRWARAVRVVERCQSLLDCSRVFLVRAAARPRGSTTIQASP